MNNSVCVCVCVCVYKCVFVCVCLVLYVLEVECMGGGGGVLLPQAKNRCKSVCMVNVLGFHLIGCIQRDTDIFFNTMTVVT